MTQLSSVLAAVTLVAASANVWSGTTTLNFNTDLPASVTAMSNSPGSAVPAGSQLSDQYSTGSSPLGVLFSSSSPYVAVVNAISPNGIGGATAAGQLSYADPILFTFVVPGTNTPGVTDNFSVQADPTGIPGQYATVQVFDANGLLLDSQTLNDVGSEIWSFSIPGIHTALFTFPTTSTGAPATGTAFGNGTGIALDNVSFDSVTAASPSTPSAVPLPPMIWQGLAVTGAIAVARRLSRQQQNA